MKHIPASQAFSWVAILMIAWAVLIASAAAEDHPALAGCNLMILGRNPDCGSCSGLTRDLSNCVLAHEVLPPVSVSLLQHKRIIDDCVDHAVKTETARCMACGDPLSAAKACVISTERAVVWPAPLVPQRP
jgi:hypothetical protein